MFVMTIDQRGSTGAQDKVPELIARISRLSDAGFERSVGDELQGVVADTAEVVDIALHALRTGSWYVGIGVGAVNLPPGASPREGTGAGFVAARRAVELAKAAATQVPLSVVSGSMVSGSTGKESGAMRGKGEEWNEGVRACANAEAVLRLLGRVVQGRTEAQWRVVDALGGGYGEHGRQKQVAAELGITEQSVSRTVLRSGWPEEWAARPAAAMLLDHARSQVLEAAGKGTH
jgi:hypothetical protein